MEFPQWVKDRVIARQGCLHPYDELPAARLAVVVVDMQQYFTLPGYQGECAPAREIIAPINRLCDAVRAAGGTIVWVQTASDNADSFWSHHHGVMLTPERSARRESGQHQGCRAAHCPPGGVRRGGVGGFAAGTKRVVLGSFHVRDSFLPHLPAPPGRSGRQKWMCHASIVREQGREPAPNVLTIFSGSCASAWPGRARSMARGHFTATARPALHARRAGL